MVCSTGDIHNKVEELYDPMTSEEMYDEYMHLQQLEWDKEHGIVSPDERQQIADKMNAEASGTNSKTMYVDSTAVEVEYEKQMKAAMKARDALEKNVSAATVQKVNAELAGISGLAISVNGKEYGGDTWSKVAFSKIVKSLHKPSVVLEFTRTGKDGKKNVFQAEFDNTGESIDGNVQVYDDRVKAAIGVLLEGDSDARFSDAKTENDKFKQRQTEILGKFINDPKQALVLLRKLIKMEGQDISMEHQLVLEDTIKRFLTTSEFIESNNVYLDTEASRTAGVFIMNGKDKGIYVNVSKVPKIAANQMTAAEVYVHELIHAALEWGMKNVVDGGWIKSQMTDVYNKFMKKLDESNKPWLALMPADSINKVQEEKVAKELWEYLKSENGFNEFAVMSQTNMSVIKVLRSINVKDRELKNETLWDKAIGLIVKLFDGIMNIKRGEGRFKSGDEAMIEYTRRLAEVNNRALLKERKNSQVEEFVGKYIVDANRLGSKFIERFQHKGRFPTWGPDASVLEKSKVFAQQMWAITTNTEARPYIEQFLNSYGMAPEGVVQKMLQGARQSDKLETLVERMGMKAEQIDRMRNEIKSKAHLLVNNGFKAKLKKHEWRALTESGLDIDIEALQSNYSVNKIGEMLQDDSRLAAEIKVVQDKIMKLADTKSRAYYWMSQAKGLGYYMATGLAGSTQNMNAHTIVYGKVNGNTIISGKEDVIKLVDQLATLEGIGYSAKESNAVVADLIKKDPGGIKNFLLYAKMYKEDAMDRLYSEANVIHYVKGESKEISASNITTRVAPMSTRKQLEKEGFEFVEEVKMPGSALTKAAGLFVNKNHLRQDWERQGIRTTAMYGYKHSLLDAAGYNRFDATEEALGMLKRDANLAVLADLDRQRAGVVLPVLDGRRPVLAINKKGFSYVKDYEVVYDKHKYNNLVDKETKANEVLSRMIASVMDKVESKKANKDMMQVIVDDMEANWNGRDRVSNNMKIYYTIGPNETNKVSREVWPILPTDIKKNFYSGLYGKDKHGVPQMAVRADLASMYFGSRAPTILDVGAFGFTLHDITPATLRRIVIFAETVWQEIVSFTKLDMVVKAPKVVIDNIISNFILSMQTGMTFSETYKLHVQGAKELRNYLKMEKELTTLKLKKAAGTASDIEIERIPTLTNLMKKNSVAEMIKRGFYQAVIEDIDTNELRAEKPLGKFIGSVREKLPDSVNTVIDTAYMTEKTGMFKMMLMAIQDSDFAARYAQFHAYTEGKHKMPVEAAYKRVLDNMINYSNPDSAVLQYMNKMGLVLFTKFFLRIQRALGANFKDYPVNFILSLAGQGIFGNQSDVMDYIPFISKNPTDYVMDPFKVLWAGISPPVYDGMKLAYQMVK